MIYTIIKTTASHNSESIGYFNDYKEIIEFFEKQKDKYKSEGLYIYQIKKTKKGYIRYIAFRKKNSCIEKFISFSVVKLPDRNEIAFNLVNNDMFCGLYSKKRLRQVCVRFSDDEIEFLDYLAKKNNTKPATIIRTAIYNFFEKELLKWKRLVAETMITR